MTVMAMVKVHDDHDDDDDDDNNNYSRTPVTRTLKGNEKQFELAGIRVIGVNFSEIWIKGKEI